MVWQETVNLPTSVTIGSIPITSTKNAHRRFTVWRDGFPDCNRIHEVGLRAPLKPQLEFSAREHSTNSMVSKCSWTHISLSR